MIRAGIVGMGRWGRTLVDSVQGRSDEIRFVAGMARNLEPLRDYAAGLGITLCATLDALLERPDVEAVVLATPHGEHLPQILRCLEAGKPAFVEKPVTLTGSDAARVYTAARQRNLPLCVGHNRRFLPAYAALAELAAQELGDILQSLGNFSWPTAYAAGSWRADSSESPAGGMTGLGIHVIDAMIGLGASVTNVTVAARRRAPVGLEDTVTALMDCADGRLAVLTTMVQTARLWRLEIFGTRGWAAMDGESRLVYAPRGEPIRSWEFPFFDMERAELEAFARAITGEAPYPVLPAQAVHGVAVLEAICKATAAGLGGPPHSVAVERL